MTQPDGVAPVASGDDVVSPWGTWEELLLAFAVNRHGTSAWDSIAAELRKRTSLSLSPNHCRLKYLDLKRRFVVAAAAPIHDLADDKSDDSAAAAPLLEELRRLRVAELRREVQRYDLNIESLELKVKKMEEERERSLITEKTEPDLEKTTEDDVEPDPEPVEPVVGGDLDIDKDQLSVNESNSTDPDAEKLRSVEKEPEPAGPVAEEVMELEPVELNREPDLKPAREDSCNGSSNSIEKSDRKGKSEPASDSAGPVESEATKENSDVQSTASRSRKEEDGGSDKVRRGCTSGDEREHEDQSRAVKELTNESQPLFDFLQAVRANKFGSVFERRLRSQETSKYQKLILQHIDLETVETRLKEGWYSGASAKFFRDLLLLVNNALVFFAKKSPEANAANQIRSLVSKEISHRNAKSDSSSGKQVSLQSLSMSKKEDSPSPSLMLKPRISGPLIVCRKRSSIAAKASGSSSDKKKEQTPFPADEEKDSKKPSSDAEEPKITKKRTRDRFSPVLANTKKNSKNQPNNNTKQQQEGKKGGSSSEPKSDNKKNQSSTSDSKKRGAANFLNRMKQSSSPVNNNGDLLDALKNTPLTSEGNTSKGGSEQKKSENAAKRGEKKEAVTTRRSLETRQTKDKGSPGKRNVGRPPKRGAPPPDPPPAAVGKRGRGETETPAAKQQPKKRTRKL